MGTWNQPDNIDKPAKTDHIIHKWYSIPVLIRLYFWQIVTLLRYYTIHAMELLLIINVPGKMEWCTKTNIVCFPCSAEYILGNVNIYLYFPPPPPPPHPHPTPHPPPPPPKQ